MNKHNPFYWGSATSSFQIEGSPLADGAAASDWYRVSHMKDKIDGGDIADIACDHYRRWEEDIAIMEAMKLNAYRFSIAWPRVMNAPHQLNTPGLDFYDRLVDGLCARNIEPFITLFHWDVPAWLDDMGGWVADDVVKHYIEYAAVVFDRLGDRVRHWVTFNEPLVYQHSYITGWHWPFHRNRFDELLLCWDNILQAHHQTAALYKSQGGTGAIGLVHSYHLLKAASDSSADRAALNRADGFRNRWFLSRLFEGTYPADMLELFKSHIPQRFHDPVDNTLFSKPDFIGLNYYAVGKIKHDPAISVLNFSDVQDEFELQPNVDSYPSGLYDMVRKVNEIYAPGEIYITENGYLEYESTERDPLQDTDRQQYLLAHVEEVQRCVADGLPVRGYFHWSLLDNFEWRWGLSRRYGLVHVDRKTQDRRIKNSGWAYRDFIENACTSELSQAGS